ncbi:hypothetical protein CASFOL_007603 [Castilleja foliolosa]|uniref:Uncharacterized protein n=1 Tax=Castilleja foliolosa TaxID=1961234 RepID=A0ABD3E225_9LAMI
MGGSSSQWMGGLVTNQPKGTGLTKEIDGRLLKISEEHGIMSVETDFKLDEANEAPLGSLCMEG